jgi:hypothetical protein
MSPKKFDKKKPTSNERREKRRREDAGNHLSQNPAGKNARSNSEGENNEHTSPH